MPRVLATFQATLSTSSTDWTYVPVMDVLPVAGVADVDIVTEQYATNTELRVEAARVFYEARTDRPGAWAVFSGQSNQSGDGDWTDSFDITTDAASQMYFRVGLAIKSATAGKVAQGDFEVTLIVRQEGKIVGQQSFTLNPSLNTGSETAYYPLSAWLPTLGLASLKGAFVVEAVSGTLKYRLAWRTADTDTREPNAWQELDSFQTASSNTVYNTGNESVTFTDERWYQVGLAIQGQTGEGIIHMTACCTLSRHASARRSPVPTAAGLGLVQRRGVCLRPERRPDATVPAGTGARPGEPAGVGAGPEPAGLSPGWTRVCP